MSTSEEKTEQASELKLREARKKGQVAKSTDVVALCALFFTTLFLLFSLPYGLKKMSLFVASIHSYDYRLIDLPRVRDASRHGFDVWFFLSAPVLLVACIGAIVGNVGQFGFLLSTHPITPDIKKIDPVQGCKKLFSKDRLIEFLKQLVKFSAVFLVIYVTVRNALAEISMLFRLDLMHSLSVISELIITIIFRVLLCFLAIAVFDFFWQRYSFLKSMRMSKYEVKKEYKQQEGDPHIKQERRRIHQETVDGAQNEIQDASVVITNPSHLAIALRYHEEEAQTPFILAKGVGPSAKQLISQAHRYEIPVMRNVPLARDLQWLEINEEIPERLFDSVAEILTFIYELSRTERGSTQ